MMLHDHCQLCEVKRPIILGRVNIEGWQYDHICHKCITCISDRLPSDVTILVQLYAMSPTGTYARIYYYDGMVNDLMPSYRPNAYRSN
jgi:hypothetical protein